MRVERELEIKRAAGQRRDARDQVRRELSAKLEAIKLEEVHRLIRARGSKPPENPAVVFASTLEGGRVTLPWGVPSEPSWPASPDFARHRQEG